MQIYAKIKEGLKRFIKKEPVYFWLVLFIILINLMMFLGNLSKEAVPQETPRKVSKARELIKGREKLESAIIGDERMSIIAALIIGGIAVLILLGLLLDFVIFIKRTDKKELLERSHSPPRSRWNISDAVKVIILFLFFGYVIVIIEVLFAPFFPFIKADKTVVSIVNSTIVDLISIIAVFYFAVFCHKHRLRDLGLTLKNFFKNIFYGILGYISVIPILIVTLLVTATLLNLFKYEPQPQIVLELFLEEEKRSVLLYLSIFVAVGGPIMEEIFFRGFLYNAIKKDIGIRWAILISALLFSFLHAHLVGFLPILILGVFLAYLYERTGSLVPSITVHAIHNLIMVSFIFLIKGINL